MKQSLTLTYGTEPDQVADLHLPAAGDAPYPVVALVHGGFWWQRFDRRLMAGVAADLTDRGYAAWNVEYRRVGSPGGGWPSPALDVAAALDHLTVVAEGHELDPDRVVVVGHSAGAYLAVWAAGRDAPAPRDPSGHLRPRAIVTQAGVLLLERAFQEDLGPGAVRDLLGGAPTGAVLDEAALERRLPTGVLVVLIHGNDDQLVPASQSRGYAEAALTAGDPVELVVLPDVGHFEHIDPAQPAWTAVLDRLPELLG